MATVAGKEVAPSPRGGPSTDKPDGGSKGSCADARHINLKRCTAFVLYDGLPGDDYNKTAKRSATSPGWQPYDQDGAQAFVTGSENVLLDSFALPLEFEAGVNALDVFLVAEHARTIQPGFEPNDTAVIEYWRLDGQVPTVLRGAIVHLPSTVHPKLLASTRYWVYISVPEPASSVAWYAASVTFPDWVWIAERNTETGFIWSVADTTGGAGLRVTALH